MALLFLSPGQTFGTVGGFQTTDVVGTNSNETVFTTADAKANFDASFNRGGDTINIAGNAGLYTASLQGSSLLLTANNGANILIPVGAVGTTIDFLDAAPRILSFNTTTGQVTLGDQTITAVATQVTPGIPLVVEVTSPSVAESDNNGSTQLSYRLTLSEAQNQPLTINVSTSDGTATAGEDYVAIAQQVTFAAGETVKIVNVQIIGDTKLEGDETVSLTVSGAGIVTAVGTGTILNDDFAPVFNGGDAIIVQVNEDAVLNGVVTATDADNDPLTFALVSNAANGVAVVATNGSYTYTPGANFNGSDSFVVSVSDGNGGLDTQTVNVTVNPVDDAPTFAVASQTVSVTENIGEGVTIAAAVATDIDGEALTYSLTGPDAALFEVIVVGGQARVSLLPGQNLDFENPTSQSGNNTYLVTLVATDSADPLALSASQNIVINVTDLQEAFTTAVDLLNGTDQDDVFFAFNNALNAGDRLDAKGDNFPTTMGDVVFHRIDVNNAQNQFAGFELVNVEKFSITNDDPTANTVGGGIAWDLSSSDFIPVVENLNSRYNVSFDFGKTDANGVATLNVTNLTDSAVDTLFDLADGSVVGATTVNLNISNVDDALAGDRIAIDGGVETININVADQDSTPTAINDLDERVNVGAGPQGAGTNTLNITNNRQFSINNILDDDVRFVTQTAGANGALFLDLNNTNGVADPNANPVGAGTRGSTTVTVNDGNNTLTGGSQNDTFTAGDGNNLIDTNSGADTVTVGDGNNVIDTGTGANNTGSTGAPTTDSAGDSDVVTAGNGNNIISTGNGNDVVNAGVDGAGNPVGNGNNLINLGAGNDVANTGNGDDTVNAGAGNDLVNTNGGCDSITAGSGLDTINAGADHDIIVFAATGDFDATIPLVGPIRDQVDGGTGTDDLRIFSDNAVDSMFQNIAAGSIEHLTIINSANTTIGNGAGFAQTAGIDTINLDRSTTFGALTNNDIVNAGSFTSSLTVNTRGGTDAVTTGSGNDTFNVGADFTNNKGVNVPNAVDGALDDSDLFNGGAGTDSMFLDGDVAINSNTGGQNNGSANGFTQIENITIDTGTDEGSNNSASFILDNDNAPSGNGTLTINASSFSGINGNNETLTVDGTTNGALTTSGAVTAFSINATGGSGNDTFTDGGQNDTFTGNGGNDTFNIIGSGGNQAFGNAGNDYFLLGIAGGGNLLDGDTGADIFDINGAGGVSVAPRGTNFLLGSDTLQGGASTDSMYADTGLSDGALANSFSIENLFIQDQGGATVNLGSNAENNTGITSVWLSNGNTLNANYATTGITVDGQGFTGLTSGGGNNTITTGGGGDTVLLGDGAANTVVTNGGNDTVSAAQSVDNISTGAGDDTVRIDTNEWQADDSFAGGAGNDQALLDNNNGNITAVFNLNNVTNVERVATTGDGNINGGVFEPNNNVITFQDGMSPTTQLTTVDLSSVTDPLDTNTILFGGPNPAYVNTQFFVNYGFDVIGSSTADILIKNNEGPLENNDITANLGGGNDVFEAAGGDFGANIVVNFGETGESGTGDALRQRGGLILDDDLRTIREVETLTTVSGMGLNAILGGEAFDAGFENIIGSSAMANDNVTISSFFTRDLDVTLFGGTDIFNAGASTSAITFNFTGNELDVTDLLTGGTTANDQIIVQPTFGGSTTGDTTGVRGVETITINGDNDVPNGNTSTNYTLTLGANAGLNGVNFQTIDASGFDAADVFTLNGGAATYNINVTGGAGNDVLTTGSGSDTVAGGEGNNVINAGNGNNVVTAGNGTNTVTTGTGSDSVTLGNGNNNNVSTGAGADTVVVGNGNGNLINTGDGNDTVTVGNGFNNVVILGAGDDTVTTGTGSTRIVGGSNASNGSADNFVGDTLNLGTGSDIVHMMQQNDSFGLNLDCVFDFDQGLGDDVIWLEQHMLSTIFAGGVQGVNYLGEAGDSQQAAFTVDQSKNDGFIDIVYDRSTDRLLIDLNDDGLITGQDMVITMKNVAGDNFSIADFLVVDTIAPAAPTVVDLLAVDDSGVSSSDDITSVDPVTIRVSFNTTPTDGSAVAVGDTITLSGHATGPQIRVLDATDIANGFYDYSVDLDNNAVNALSATISDGTNTSDPVTLTVTHDNTAPTVVSVTVDDTALNIGDDATVTIVFDEAVANFELGELAAENGTLSNLQTLDNITFTATLTPAVAIEDATNVVTVSAGNVTDAAGNGLLIGPGATSNNYAVDTVAPTVTSITFTDTVLSDATPSTVVTVVFSEAVQNFDSSDITVANGTFGVVMTGDNITFTVQFTATDEVEDATNVATVNVSDITDAASNALAAALNSANYVVDTRGPVFTTGLTAAAINENSGAGQAIYDANANDASVPIIFSLGAAGGDEGAFTIDPNTGVVTLTGDPDFETQNSYSFEVVATDNLGNVNAQVVALAINDINEPFAATLAAFAANSFTLNVFDPDDNGTYSLVSPVDGQQALIEGDNVISVAQKTVPTTTNVQVTDGTDTVSVFTLTQGTAGDDVMNAPATGFGLYYGFGGEDTVDAGNGDDVIFGGDDDDNLDGNGGNDTIFGEAGNDNILGAGGDDVIDGGSGNDVIRGGSGSDMLTGGTGTDEFILSSTNGTDTITDFSIGDGDQIIFDISGLGLNAADYTPGATMPSITAANADALGAGNADNHVINDDLANILTFTNATGAWSGPVLAVAQDTDQVLFDLDGDFTTTGDTSILAVTNPFFFLSSLDSAFIA